MKPFHIFSIFALFILIMDLYAFRGLSFLVNRIENELVIKLFPWFFWGITVCLLAGLIWAGSVFQNLRNPDLFYGITVLMGVFLMIYVPKLSFNVVQLLNDISHLITRLVSESFRYETIKTYFLGFGAAIGFILFIAFGMGMLRGRTDVRIFREEIKMPELPVSFSPLKIVQLSDLHLVGFHNDPGHIRKVVKMVNELNPDLILFTGDMVNNFSEEIDPFVEIFNDLKAQLGKFAILGNHDYGHYHNWKSEEEKSGNLELVKQQIRASGFDLLLNENRTISRNGDSIEIIGVENWGKPPFPQYGDLEKAKKDLNGAPITILLSHDPSHWDLQIREKEDIDLTLSGHTHGMQFGFEIGKFRWSPSRWQYEHWAGLYEENGKYLYVNRGLGFTGFPGRVGIKPEITLLTLTRDQIQE